MADAERKRIRCIIRPRQFGQMKDIFGHLHHLALFCIAVADYCHFDLIGCIGNRFKPLLRKRKQDDAARLRDLDTSRYVLGKEQLFDRYFVRMERVHQRANIVIYLAQAQMHRQAGGCFGCAILHRRKFHIVKPHNTVADRAVARVNAKNRQKKPLPDNFFILP